MAGREQRCRDDFFGSFRGQPRGRSVVCRPSRVAVRATSPCSRGSAEHRLTSRRDMRPSPRNHAARDPKHQAIVWASLPSTQEIGMASPILRVLPAPDRPNHGTFRTAMTALLGRVREVLLDRRLGRHRPPTHGLAVHALVEADDKRVRIIFSVPFAAGRGDAAWCAGLAGWPCGRPRRRCPAACPG